MTLPALAVERDAVPAVRGRRIDGRGLRGPWSVDLEHRRRMVAAS